MDSTHRTQTFIASLDPGHPPHLESLYESAKTTNIPIISREVQSILKLFLTIQNPKHILEIGCAIGFSALLMSEYVADDCKITTIEKDKKRCKTALENFNKYNKAGKITLIEGDARKILKSLDTPYDFIFMDAAKGQYPNFLPDILRLLVPGGLLITDNILQDGDILESRYAVTRRDRTIHTRMREYLYEIKHHSELCTEIFDVGDGITISYRQPN